MKTAIYRDFDAYFRKNRKSGSLNRDVDAGNLSTLVPLDLSAAFDTVDTIDILLGRLSKSFGGIVLDWFRSHLTGRVQCISDMTDVSHH
jgi:hypothetical protein